MGCYKGMGKKVKSIDMFGKPIIFNYTKKDKNFKSFFGGVVSIILYLTIIAYGI